MRRARTDKRLSVATLGVLGVVFCVLFVYGAFTKRVPLVEGYRVTGVFSSSNELRKGSPVRIAGVDVGKVVKLDHGPGTTALVEMELKDSARPLHRDAELRIRPRLFLEGGFYVDVRPGSPSAPEIEDGGTIPLGQTAIPVQFDQVLTGGFSRPARDSFQRLLDEVGTSLGDGGARDLGAAQRPAVPALRDVAIVAEAARGVREHDASDTVRAVSRITSALAANDEALGGLVSGMARTTGALAAEQAALRATVRGLDDVFGEAPAALSAIDRGLPPVRALARDVRPALREAPPVLRRTVALVDQLDRATRAGELPGLLPDLGAAVRALPTLERRLTTLFPLVDPVTDCVRDKALPVLNAKLDDGKLTTNRPVWQELASSFVGLNSASQPFDANGYAVRYLFTLGNGTVNLGEVPGLGSLVGSAAQGINGVRPKWNGAAGLPPFRPDAPCREQQTVNPQTEASPTIARFTRAPARRAAKPVTPAQFRRAVQRLTKKGGR